MGKSKGERTIPHCDSAQIEEPPASAFGRDTP